MSQPTPTPDFRTISDWLSGRHPGHQPTITLPFPIPGKHAAPQTTPVVAPAAPPTQAHKPTATSVARGILLARMTRRIALGS